MTICSPITYPADRIAELEAQLAKALEDALEEAAYARIYNGEIMVDGLFKDKGVAERELARLNAEFPMDADKRKIIPLYALKEKK